MYQHVNEQDVAHYAVGILEMLMSQKNLPGKLTKESFKRFKVERINPTIIHYSQVWTTLER